MGKNEKKSGVLGDAENVATKTVKPRPYDEDGSVEDVIELSEIALGRSSGDESVIELTEDVVDSAFEGVLNAAGSSDYDENRLDISTPDALEHDKIESDKVAATSGHPMPPMGGAGMAPGDKIDAIEEDITKELDNYFQLEEQAIDLLDDTVDKMELHGQPVSEPVNVFEDEPVSVAREQFESALESVIEKLYAEKIDRILTEVIERVVTEDIERLKEYILKQS
ncbi:MAG: hypothetical protein GXP53_14405 [Deltaproteobacteria bacterium]|nr:hypothetical protein [Deltaproteobacteria bacterium]